MKQTLYLMRHGETLFNYLGKVQGYCDSPLTKRGIKQAEIAGQYFKRQGVTFPHAYVSTQERAIDTLEIVTENKIPYERLKGLKEMDHGLFEGESAKLQPKSIESYESFYTEFGGETSGQVEQRMAQTLTSIMNKEDQQDVLVVSHGGASFCFLRAVVRDELERLPNQLMNCSILKFSFENDTFTFEEIIDHDFSALAD